MNLTPFTYASTASFRSHFSSVLFEPSLLLVAYWGATHIKPSTFARGQELSLWQVVYPLAQEVVVVNTIDGGVSN
jgi:hypothetical protein